MQNFTLDRSKYDDAVTMDNEFVSQPGLTEDLVRFISAQKKEPSWMLQKRLQGFELFQKTKIPSWGPNLKKLNLDKIAYYVKPGSKEAKKWEEVPEEIRKVAERLGIPEAERKALSGAGFQWDSDMMYHNLKEEWHKQGVIFENMDVALQKYPELVKKYFMTSCIPVNDHKFIMLHAAVWSGGTFIYIPPKIKVRVPLQAYFRMNAEAGGQFEHTLIIADKESEVHYIEGCSAARFDASALHAGCVELFVLENARIRYSSVENWSKNTFNLNTKRAVVERHGTVEWINGNLGCLTGDSQIFTNPKGPIPIQNIEAGDKIFVWDEKTNSIKKSKVKAKIFSGHKEVFLLQAGGREIKASSNHPFLTIMKKKRLDSDKEASFEYQWRALEQLHLGDLVGIAKQFPTEENLDTLSISVNEQIGFARIQKIESLGVQPTFDIEVENYHNFISNGLIVHNSGVTMLYPCSILKGEYAKSDSLGIAFAGPGQNQDTGSKVIHAAPNTTSTIKAKSISKGGGISSYRGSVQVSKNAINTKCSVVCDALLIDDESVSNTFPFMRIDNNKVYIAHEASVGKIGEEEIFYLMSRGLSEEQAMQMVVSGFIEPIVKQLPLEYAVELNKLIELEMEGTVG